MPSLSPAASVAEGTFRDPQGTLYLAGSQILRELYPDHVDSVLTWLRSPTAQA